MKRSVFEVSDVDWMTTFDLVIHFEARAAGSRYLPAFRWHLSGGLAVSGLGCGILGVGAKDPTKGHLYSEGGEFWEVRGLRFGFWGLGFGGQQGVIRSQTGLISGSGGLRVSSQGLRVLSSVMAPVLIKVSLWWVLSLYGLSLVSAWRHILQEIVDIVISLY